MCGFSNSLFSKYSTVNKKGETTFGMRDSYFVVQRNTFYASSLIIITILFLSFFNAETVKGFL